MTQSADKIMIEELTKERDDTREAVRLLWTERDALAADICQMSDNLVAIEGLRHIKDARMYAEMHKLKSAAKLALDALEDCRDVLYQVAHGNQACSDAEGVGSTLPDVFEALKKAGVQ